jgi:glutathione synthase/RimK-type ligase-like ATP-grasp enzyme
MSDIWIITRSLTNEIALNLTLDDAIKNDYNMTEDELYNRERFCESLKLKAELDSLGISCEFKRAKDLISPGYLRCVKELPKITIDLFPAWDHHNHNDNLNTLREIGVKVINNPKIHRICTDKWEYHKILKNHNIPTIQSMLVSLPISDDTLKEIESSIEYPVVIKPTNGSLSRGVIKCHNLDDIWYASSKIYKLPFKPRQAIIQKWVDHSVKGVLRTMMIGGNIVACAQRYPSIQTDFFYSGKAENSIRVAYKLTPELIKYCNSVYLALDKIDICAMDILYDDKNYVACDINSPGNFIGLDILLNTNIAKSIAEYLVSKL